LNLDINKTRSCAQNDVSDNMKICWFTI